MSAFAIFIHLYGRSIINEFIQRYVALESKNNYTLTYESFDFEPFAGQITLHEAKLTPKETADSLLLPTRYRIELRKMEVTLQEVLAVYTDRKVHISGITVYDPVVEFIKEKDTETEITLDLGNLYLSLSDYIEVLQIDEFEIESGSFIHNPSGQQFDGINFYLESFVLDSTDAKNEIFYSEKIEISLDQQSFILPDSLHAFSFESLVMSTADSVLSFKEATIKPLDSLSTEVELRYDIHVPSLDLVGIDYLKAYKDKQLIIDSLKLQNPEIAISGSKPTRDKKRKKASSVFSGHSIGVLLIEQAQLSYKNETSFHIDQVNLKILDVALDESFDLEKQWFSAANANMSVLSMLKTDSSFIKVDSVSASSSKNSVLINGLSIGTKDSVDHTQFLLTTLALDGIDIVDAIKKKSVVAKRMHIYQPQVKIPTDIGGGVDQSVKLSVDSAYRTLQPFINKIQSDSLVIEKGQLTAGNFSIKNFSFQSDAFLFDESVESWQNITKNENLNATVVLNKYPYRITGQVNYIEELQHILLENPTINHLENDSLSITASRIDSYGISLDDFLSDPYPQSDSVVISEPNIDWAISNASNNSMTMGMFLGKVSIKNGSVILRMDGGQIEGDSIFFQLQNTIDDTLRYHSLHAGEIRYTNSSQNVKIRNLAYEESDASFSMDKVKVDTDDFKLSIPQIAATGWDQNLWNDKGALKLDQLTINRPLLTGETYDQSQSDTISFPFKIAIQRIEIKDGQAFYKSNTGDSIDLALKSINLQLSEFDSDNALLENEEILFSRDASLNLSESTIGPKNTTVKFSNLDYNSSKGLITISDISQLNKNQPSPFLIEKALFKDLDLQALKNDQLIAENITIDGAEFTLRSDSSQNRQGQQFELPFETVSVGHLDLNKSSFTVTSQRSKPALNLDHLDLDIHNLESNGNTSLSELLSSNQSLSVQGKNFFYPVEASNYLLKVGDYAYDHELKAVRLSQIALEPQLDRLAYSTTLTYQKDWFDVSLEHLNVSDFDLEALLQTELVDLGIVELEGLRAEVFRDKHLPFDETQRRPLPQTMLKQLDLLLKIDTIKVKGDITYSERPGSTQNIASVGFTNLDGRIINLATRDSLFRLPMYLQATGTLLGSGDFSAHVSFAMDDPKDAFKFRGRVGPMDLTTMTRLLRPIANIKIKSGVAKETHFVFDGNNELATGTMNLRYNKLNIAILDKDTKEIRGFTQNLKTFFANTFVIRKSNPRLLSFRDGTIFYERDKKRAIFNFWSKTILSGAVTSVGINRTKRNLLRYKREHPEEAED
ncbi:hypothetical protein [Fulvivirga aurantia]|uniref:hypothetical protein n=1 Tax=Fulvivirga aurantia TaxID=2529383 RepID=UPI0012BCE1C9|nr:hypothetical protein [Fulvivirga aurantia]